MPAEALEALSHEVFNCNGISSDVEDMMALRNQIRETSNQASGN